MRALDCCGRIKHSLTYLCHCRINEVAAGSKTLRLSDSPLSRPNERCDRGHTQDSPTRLRHGQVGDVVVFESNELNFRFIIAELELQLHRGPIKKVSVSKSKTLRLTFVAVESERSLQPSRSSSRLNRRRHHCRIETLTPLRPTQNFDLITAK